MFDIITIAQAQDIAQIASQTDAPWWDKYTWEIVITVFTSICGYIIGQHYKTTGDRKGWMVAVVNGIISGGLAAWFWPEKWGFEISLQAGVAIGISSPFIVWIMFLGIDWLFPGKANTFKQGAYWEDNDDEIPMKTKLAAVLAGRRKESRTSERTEVWTEEQRKAFVRNMKDGQNKENT